MWMRIGMVLGWNESVGGIPVPVGHISSGMHSPRVQGTAPAPLSHSAAPLCSLKYADSASPPNRCHCPLRNVLFSPGKSRDWSWALGAQPQLLLPALIQHPLAGSVCLSPLLPQRLCGSFDRATSKRGWEPSPPREGQEGRGMLSPEPVDVKQIREVTAQKARNELCDLCSQRKLLNL